jgi:hypothetical protein
MASAPALFDRWQAHGAGSAPHAHLATRSFSLFGFGGSSSKDTDTAAVQVLPGDDAPGAAAEAATSTSSAAAAAGAAGDASLSFTPDAIIDAAGVAETAALAAALEDAWLPSRALQYSLRAVHDAGVPWWESIMLTTAGVRLVMLPIMLMQIKNTYKLSQARPEIERLLEHMKEEQAKGNTNATVRAGPAGAPAQAGGRAADCKAPHVTHSPLQPARPVVSATRAQRLLPPSRCPVTRPTTRSG